MSPDLVSGSRNLVLLFLILTSASCLPGTAALIAQPVIRMIHRARQVNRSIKLRFGLQKPSRRFWEIDMTKFEP